MTYTRSRVQWASGASGGTLIRALDMNHIEDGIVDTSTQIDQMQLTINDQTSEISALAAQIAVLQDQLIKVANGAPVEFVGTGTFVDDGNGNLIFD